MYTIIFQVPTDASSEILFGCGSTTRMKAREFGRDFLKVKKFRTKTRCVKCKESNKFKGPNCCRI